MNDKQRLVEVTDPHEAEYLQAHRFELDVPMISESGDGRVWALSESLRAWRASQHTSGTTDGS